MKVFNMQPHYSVISLDGNGLHCTKLKKYTAI